MSVKSVCLLEQRFPIGHSPLQIMFLIHHFDFHALNHQLHLQKQKEKGADVYLRVDDGRI